MKHEPNELIQILSQRYINPRIDQQCAFCSVPLYPGEKCYSFGIVDRLENSLGRIYVCKEHGYIFSSKVEDLQPWEQRFLLENRYCTEIWCEE